MEAEHSRRRRNKPNVLQGFKIQKMAFIWSEVFVGVQEALRFHRADKYALFNLIFIRVIMTTAKSYTKEKLFSEITSTHQVPVINR
jgi:hypothetical protein